MIHGALDPDTLKSVTGVRVEHNDDDGKGRLCCHQFDETSAVPLFCVIQPPSEYLYSFEGQYDNVFIYSSFLICCAMLME